MSITDKFLTIMALAVLGGLLGVTARADKPAGVAIAAKCQADLGLRLKVPQENITLIKVEATTWPDSALGMPEPDMMYAQALTPGWRIILAAHGAQYLYTASATAFKYGGPLDLWQYSMLYLQPVPDEPNMNGDLYQCSMLGTNSVKIAAGVSDYYPQRHGAVIFTRRTSRSGFELLLVNAANAGKEQKLAGAFDFGAAALNDAQTSWAAFARPMVGAAWNVMVARVGQDDATPQTLPLPDGVNPGRIAWVADKLLILVKKGEGAVCYAITPSAEKPAWTQVAANTFPQASYMLNKSESLEIRQLPEAKTPTVEVSRLWFTGDRTVLATIPGLTLRGDDFLAMRYAVVWGDADGKLAADTVDIRTGEVLPGIHGAYQNSQPFHYAPTTAPYPVLVDIDYID